MATQIQVRRDTEGDWNTADPTLAQGEIGLILGSSNEITGLKVGDGATRWEALKLALPMLSGVANILEESDSASGQPVGGTGDSSGDVTTFLLKGLSLQNAAVFGIEEADGTDLVLSIDKLGGITASGGVNVSGGYDATNDTYGVTIDANGNVQTNTGVESGDYIADCTKGGVLLTTDAPASPDGTEPKYGKVSISAMSTTTATDNVIEVRNNNAEVFVVEADGDIDKVKNIAMTGAITGNTAITTTGIVTCQGIANTAANITMGSKKITGLLDPTLAQDAVTKTYVDSMSGRMVDLSSGIGDHTNVSDMTFTMIAGYNWIDFARMSIDLCGSRFHGHYTGNMVMEYKTTAYGGTWLTGMSVTPAGGNSASNGTSASYSTSQTHELTCLRQAFDVSNVGYISYFIWHRKSAAESAITTSTVGRALGDNGALSGLRMNGTKNVTFEAVKWWGVLA
jgi:hypothetical protein